MCLDIPASRCYYLVVFKQNKIDKLVDVFDGRYFIDFAQFDGKFASGSSKVKENLLERAATSERLSKVAISVHSRHWSSCNLHWNALDFDFRLIQAEFHLNHAHSVRLSP